MTFRQLLKAASLTEQMVERRDGIRRMLGAKYETDVAPAKRIVRAVAERDRVSVIQAALRICERAMAGGCGGAVGLVVSAAVELCEEGTVPE